MVVTTNWSSELKARPPSWLQALALNDDIISAHVKQKENSSPERGGERERAQRDEEE